MFYVDLFDVTTNQIRILQDANIVVICSFSAGTYEENREDEDNFPLTAIGNLRADSEGEYWIDINHEGILSVMNDRLDRASEKGCDGVGPDAVEAYALGFEVTGCDISAGDQLTYNQWLANQAHARNLSVGLRNDVDQLTELEPYFDWALTTDCYTLGLCDEYDVFTGQGKAVVAAEFLVRNLTLCNSTYAESIDFIVKGSELDDRRCSCGFPDTNVECSSLLAANIPTEPPSSGRVSEDGSPSPMGDGSHVEAAPTWLIVTVIAVVVFIAMIAGGAYAWRERLKRLGKWGDSTTEGVDDFCT